MELRIPMALLPSLRPPIRVNTPDRANSRLDTTWWHSAWGIGGSSNRLEGEAQRAQACSGAVLQEEYIRPAQPETTLNTMLHASRSLQSICKEMDFMIRFRREASDGEDHGCEGDFGKEVCCAAER